MTAPVSYLISDSPQSLRTMRQRLMDERLKHIEQLCGAGDWADFKERLGKIRGLELATRICDEVEKEMRN